MKETYSVYLQGKKPNSGAYLSHRGRTEWSLRTARKHKADVVKSMLDPEDGRFSDFYQTVLLVKN